MSPMKIEATAAKYPSHAWPQPENLARLPRDRRSGLADDIGLYGINILLGKITGKAGHPNRLQHATENNLVEQFVFLWAHPAQIRQHGNTAIHAVAASGTAP